MQKFFKKNNRGYTLLFAMLTAALVLGVAVFIAGVSRKQFILSSTARESMYSLYAADSGLECVVLNKFILDSANASPIICSGGKFNGLSSSVPTWTTFSYQYGQTIVETDPAAKKSVFNIGFGDGSSVTSCATIVLFLYSDTTKNYKSVQSSGHNVCNGSTYAADITSPKTVERTLELRYTESKS